MRSLTIFRLIALNIPLLALLGGCAVGPDGSELRRSDTVLGSDWKFMRQDVPSAAKMYFDDSRWQAVSLPHTWNALDGQDGGDNYYRGPGWYRRHITLDSQNGRRTFIRFEGASLAAEVFVNGQSAGTHRGGFGAFCFDITPLVHAGDNEISVRVDNSHFDDIPPLSGDFTVFGGLYRNVHLFTLNAIHISPTDDASSGVYLKPQHVDEDSATVRATAKLRNDTDDRQTVAADFEIRDAAGTVVATARTEQSIAPHASADAQVELPVSHPHLWNGRPDPYLYQTSVELSQGERWLDRVDQPLGLRYFRVDAQRGFILNGRPYSLHGVDRHQDHLDMGWATTPAQIDQDYSMIEEMGCTAVRLAHYQHPDYEYSLCDRAGIAVWAELAMVNRIGDTPAFSENARQQLRELIKQNYNHPSIFFWSLYNELGPHTRTDWNLVHELNDLAHRLDPGRLTVAATHLPAEIPVNWIPDIIAFNRYYGWYTGTMNDWPGELDKLHAAYPNAAIGISEYGAGASVNQHEDRPTSQPSTKGHWHPEEWQSAVHEAAWRAMRQRPWLWGTYVWVMFDFASDGRNEGDQPGRNDKGLVTADRLIKKDAFYFYKANWTSDPFVYITSRRFNPRPAGRAELKVYSNCDTVELFLNGASLGRRSNADHVFVWPEVTLPAGKCVVRAVGSCGGGACTDSCGWDVVAEASTEPSN